MSQNGKYLPGGNPRAQRMRLDIARILKRFHFCEQALIIAQAGWLAGIASLDAKIELARMLWEDAKTGDELRTRVLELRYPSRLLDIGEDAPVVSVFENAIQAPSGTALLLALVEVYKPAQLAAYTAYLNAGDAIADGPSIRFMTTAAREKQQQSEDLKAFANEALARAGTEATAEARAWVKGIASRLEAAGGLTLEATQPVKDTSPAPGSQPFALAEKPARDERYHQCRFYWPNIIDENYPYGEGIMLQLRSAVSHLNEVWAIETGGAILQAFADKLPWEFTMEAARWTYDEARHTRMGVERLAHWGYKPAELPLGTYIFASAEGQAPIYRLGMLHHFETKNIGKKNDRAAAFESYADDVSRHDMEFDWADETIHAHYGSKWIAALREKYPDDVPEKEAINQHCEELVEQLVQTATAEELESITQVAENIIAKAQQLV